MRLMILQYFSLEGNFVFNCKRITMLDFPYFLDSGQAESTTIDTRHLVEALMTMLGGIHE
jgi:hypothetical protein